MRGGDNGIELARMAFGFPPGREGGALVFRRHTNRRANTRNSNALLRFVRSVCIDLEGFRGGVMAQRTNRTERFDLRLTPAAKQTLQFAADSSRESISDFILKSALTRADVILADRRVIKLNDEQREAFVAGFLFGFVLMAFLILSIFDSPRLP
jgi:uncharacterized protein (DUF1778 family)